MAGVNKLFLLEASPIELISEVGLDDEEGILSFCIS